MRIEVELDQDVVDELLRVRAFFHEQDPRHNHVLVLRTFPALLAGIDKRLDCRTCERCGKWSPAERMNHLCGRWYCADGDPYGPVPCFYRVLTEGCVDAGTDR